MLEVGISETELEKQFLFFIEQIIFQLNSITDRSRFIYTVQCRDTCDREL